MATGFNRTLRAEALIPQTASLNLFTVTGTVEVAAIVGEVTVALGDSGGVNNAKLIFTDSGTSTATDICVMSS